ncbi:DUF3718 domain-containing protein [Pseudidiomarina sp. 1APP75-32.1]|uniref:DUF3718 domain-containing protein n=1 Tax=Pseudidiomarina terrestris TaxID=2820060 RepID=A0AAW7QZU7_9GAMM|nr:MULTISPECIES: DUF3718 domain-containing protein [unclassified Pseudidiomarina]MDN7124383.1 DUF3718 domain-containing protein [Pseudidiomarina sp. 1APP75-32.1]MDN7126384.1 DUF3718 domain-containing protein [Pseudidiomarina sp. 1APR75-33.1]MDN7129326.1 DUF3718 domain-containing protein [Pseudidiomarina sp. 1APR75-15]MDN7136903.1 DUF3718 domain-containing protein [Pseudidiomarina sp. 1ASP75-14]MEA3587797.1 DUF3718 domain-containing protein [Pseudidiomarina sp. 1APP75-27a]
MFKSITSWLAATSAAMVLMPLSLPASAQSYLESEEVALVFCAYVRDNHTVRLQRKLRDMRIRLRDVYSNIRCNDATLIQFAVKNDAHDIGSFIARSVHIDDIRQVGDFEWMRERNLLETPIGEILARRFQP